MADRRVEFMPLDTIRTAARNPKRHDHKGIRTSVDRFGLAELPLLDERTGQLVAGHGRLEDVTDRRRRGEEPPDGVHVDTDSGAWLVPVVRGWSSRTDSEAEAYLVASNKLTMAGGWDDDALAGMLSTLADEDLLGVTGFTEAELAKLLDDGMPDEGDAEADVRAMAWGVVVTCDDEAEQMELLERLADEGLNVRALMTG